jgi:uncharacterized protein YegL
VKSKIVVIADRSGSMESIKNDAIGGFNNFIDEQKKVDGEADLSLILFDHEYEVSYKNVDIKDVQHLNNETYVPRGMTALLDAIGKTITDVGIELHNLAENERPNKVIVCIITDGEENSSKEYTKSKIKEMVEHQRNKYSWEFIFFGANMDAVTEGVQYGFSPMQCTTYASTADGINVAYRGMSATVTQLRSKT